MAFSPLCSPSQPGCCPLWREWNSWCVSPLYSCGWDPKSGSGLSTKPLKGCFSELTETSLRCLGDSCKHSLTFLTKDNPSSCVLGWGRASVFSLHPCIWRRDSQRPSRSPGLRLKWAFPKCWTHYWELSLTAMGSQRVGHDWATKLTKSSWGKQCVIIDYPDLTLQNKKMKERKKELFRSEEGREDTFGSSPECPDVWRWMSRRNGWGKWIYKGRIKCVA